MTHVKQFLLISNLIMLTRWYIRHEHFCQKSTIPLYELDDSIIQDSSKRNARHFRKSFCLKQSFFFLHIFMAENENENVSYIKMKWNDENGHLNLLQ